MITIAYVLLAGVNDSENHARGLTRYLAGLRVKINLIPFNPYPGAEFEAPDHETVEAFQQGGLLTIEDLANRVLNCGQRTLSRDLEVLRHQGVVLPLRSTIKDMGRSISHRYLIIEHWLKGKEYSEIARSTHHSVPSIQNYVSKFKRVIALTQEGYEIHTLAFLINLSSSLVETYHQLYQDAKIAPHRRLELESFLKKGAPQNTASRRAR